MENNIGNFSQFIGMHEDGALNDDLTKMLKEMIQELNNVVLEQGGNPSGEIGLKIKLRYDSGMIEVKANTSMKKPTLERAKAAYWSTQGDLLTRQNPKQTDMFRDVTAPREVKTDIA